MNSDTLRTLIRDRAAATGLGTYRLAALSGVPRRSVRDYLAGSDLSSEYALALARAAGLAVAAVPIPGFDPGPAPRRGRPKKNLGNSGGRTPNND